MSPQRLRKGTLQNVLVQIAKCICPKLLNLFVSNCKMEIARVSDMSSQRLRKGTLPNVLVQIVDHPIHDTAFPLRSLNCFPKPYCNFDRKWNRLQGIAGRLQITDILNYC